MKNRNENIDFFIGKIVLAFFLYFFCAVSIPLLAQNDGGAKEMEEIESKHFFKTDKFLFFKEKLSLQLQLQQKAAPDKISGVLLKITSNDNAERLFLIDLDKGLHAFNVFVMHNNLMQKLSFLADSSFLANPITIALNIDFKKDETLLSVNNNVVIVPHLRFSIQNGYKFELLPELSYSSNPHFNPLLHVVECKVLVSAKESGNTFWIWFIIIILIDLLAFAFYQLRKKRKKEREQVNTDVLLQQAEPVISVHLPVKNAIYLFGRFNVYNALGEDIAKCFSPLLKELLCLLIVYSPKKGVSFSKMKETLWADKTDTSAKNNRGVYFGKLRNMLDKLGSFDITVEADYWKLSTSNVFVDYFRYKELIIKEMLCKNDVEEIIAITSNGNLLPASDYEWMDDFKDEISNETIQTLLNYTKKIRMEDEPRLILKIADIILKFDYLNEQALYLKCKVYNILGQHSSAKNTYNKFCEEYKMMYGERFKIEFQDIDSFAI